MRKQGVSIGAGWLQYWDDLENAHYYFHPGVRVSCVWEGIVCIYRCVCMRVYTCLCVYVCMRCVCVYACVCACLGNAGAIDRSVDIKYVVIRLTENIIFICSLGESLAAEMTRY